MGCPNSKLIPESDQPDSEKVVETYFPATNVILHPPKLNKDYNTDSLLQLAGYNVDSGDPPTKKVAKYMARFDPRVTAKYDIKALIGKGKFSRVVRVEHRTTRQPYAIKMIDRNRGRKVYESELSVLRRVRHPFIIQLVEVFDSKEKVYMVMELATGGELFERILAKGHFTEKDATRVLQMLLEGVRYLHNLGIAHRDLKPENLLYYHPGNDSKILITDFGLSASQKVGEPYMKEACGTPEYISPEVLAGQPYTTLVDMWSVGVITYILLSGIPPFDDENVDVLYRNILKAQYSYSGEYWKDISPLAKDFIDQLLSRDPDRRMPASNALRHQWIRSNAASSSNKNLHRTISNNILQRASSCAASTRSGHTVGSERSNLSARSFRSQHGRVQASHLRRLQQDPQAMAHIASIRNHV